MSSSDPRPAGNQFTLRGLFILMTIVCVILAGLGLVARTWQQWLGAAIIPLLCFVVIAAMEAVHRLWPPLPRIYYPGRVRESGHLFPYQTPYALKVGASPFREEPGNSPFASSEAPKADESSPAEKLPAEKVVAQEQPTGSLDGDKNASVSPPAETHGAPPEGPIGRTSES